jgi:hypothetical protein
MGPCNCAVQLWLVPFDKTDPAIKEGFGGRGGGIERIGGQSVTDTKTGLSPALSLSLSLSLSFSLSLLSPFRFGFLCESRGRLSDRECFPFGKSQDGRRDNRVVIARIQHATKLATEFNAHTEC